MLSEFLQQTHENPIAALKTAINELSKHHPHHILTMRSYSHCVLGVLNGFVNWEYDQKQILEKFFGIEFDHEIDCGYWGTSYFSEWKKSEYKPNDWEVIRLFTTEIDNNQGIQIMFWIEEAMKTLKKLEQQS